MRSVFGLLLLIGGLGLAAYLYYPEATEDHVPVVHLARFMVPVVHDSGQPPRRDPLRGLPPDSSLFEPTDSAGSNQASEPDDAPRVVVVRRNLVRPSTWTTAVNPAAAFDTQPIYTATSWPSRIAARAIDLQQELRRVGCYHGYLDGDWGPGSKRAMQAFLRKVNATLPVDQPDEFLLALLRSHPDGTCTKTCAPGQVENESGQCTASTMYASNATGRLVGAPKLTTPRLTQSASADRAGNEGPSPERIAAPARRADLPGRMSVGGPLVVQPYQSKDRTQLAALPPIKPAAKTGDDVVPSADIAPRKLPATKSVERESSRPARSTARRSAASKRYSAQARQSRLMRQAFGDIF